MKKITTPEEFELLDALIDAISQGCCDFGDCKFDTMALSAYTHGARTLAEYGVVKIHRQHGRQVIFSFKTEAYKKIADRFRDIPTKEQR